MKRFLSLSVVLMIAVFVTGCPKKPTIVKEEAKAPATDTKAQEERARKEAAAKRVHPTLHLPANSQPSTQRAGLFASSATSSA